MDIDFANYMSAQFNSCITMSTTICMVCMCRKIEIGIMNFVSGNGNNEDSYIVIKGNY